MPVIIMVIFAIMSILVIMVMVVIRIFILVIFMIMIVITIKGALREKIVGENIVVECVKATCYICICKRQVSQYLY